MPDELMEPQLWRNRFSSYPLKSLIEVVERNGKDDPLSVLADEEMKKRLVVG